MLRKIKLVFLIISLIFCGLILASPFKYNKTANKFVLESSVVINTNCNRVYTYLGDSKNASKWSVFVDHISALNTDSFNDGDKGSVRRCFRTSDETEKYWDERIEHIVPNKERELSIYNLKNFLFETSNLSTFQFYQAIDSQHCKLTFLLSKPNVDCSILEQIKIKLAAYYIKHIFNENINNIKAILEAK